MRIGIAGITGRMGRMLVAEAASTPSAELAGGLSRHPGPDDVPRFTDIAALAEACDVVIDFTHLDTVEPHARALAQARTCWVLGTTGLGKVAQQAVAQATRDIPVVQAANFSPGVCLLLALAERAALALPGDRYDAEILEMHHRQKVDAPSGTALALGEAVAAGRGQALTPLARRTRDGHTGARPVGEIGFAVQRGGQIVGEHALSFTAAGEQITLSHRAFDRAVFAEGALRAALWAGQQPPGLYGMLDVLGL